MLVSILPPKYSFLWSEVEPNYHFFFFFFWNSFQNSSVIAQITLLFSTQPPTIFVFLTSLSWPT